jgi:hypothetical protein
MGLTFSVFYVRCPACDDPVLPNSISQPGVQDLPLAKCKACGRLIQITKDRVYWFKKMMDGRLYRRSLQIRVGQEVLLSSAVEQMDLAVTAEHKGLPYKRQASITFTGYVTRYLEAERSQVSPAELDKKRQRLSIIDGLWATRELRQIGREEVSRLERQPILRARSPPVAQGHRGRLCGGVADALLHPVPRRGAQAGANAGGDREGPGRRGRDREDAARPELPADPRHGDVRAPHRGAVGGDHRPAPGVRSREPGAHPDPGDQE